MLTIEDVRAVPLFSTLSQSDLERLVRTSADVSLRPGEYAVHEGGERALFAVLSGKLEVVKMFDGVERTLGWRVPGTIFGEVPLAFASPFPGAYRAAEPSRVMRVEPQHYFAIASSAPEVAEEVGKLARERIGGLQGVAMQAPKSQVTVFGDRWDPACGDFRRFLARNQIAHDWLSPDSPHADATRGEAIPKGVERPVLRLADGTLLSRPTMRALAEKLGLPTRPRLPEYDAVVIGGGPAGLAAAVYGASEGLRTVMVEREAPGGQAGQSSRIENYLGFPAGLTGSDLARRATDQARRLGAELLTVQDVVGLRIEGAGRFVELSGGGTLSANCVLVASGVSYRQLDTPGFPELTGAGIYYGAAVTEARSCSDQHVVVIGGANSAGQAAVYFAQYADHVTVLVRGGGLERSMSHYLIERIGGLANVDVLTGTQAIAAEGEDGHLARLRVRNGDGNERLLDADACFVFIGAAPRTDWLAGVVMRDDRGFILAGLDAKADGWPLPRDPYLLETSVPGVFVAGDVRSRSIKRVASAVGEGSMAVSLVHQYLADT